MSALSPYEQWMVRSNLETIRTTEVSAAEQAARLRANGYAKIAEVVEIAESVVDAQTLRRRADG